MINQEDNPVGFAAIQYELDDAIEHLQNIVSNMRKDSQYSDEEFAVDLGHVYAHLNRSWNIRNRIDSDQPDLDREWDSISAFPKDIKVVG